MRTNVRNETILEIWWPEYLFMLVEGYHEFLFNGQPIVRRKVSISNLMAVQEKMRVDKIELWRCFNVGFEFVDFLSMDLTPYTHTFIYRYHK